MQLLLLVLIVIVASSSAAWAEVRTITATGEYRMGDNDTRADAKRIALQDAKRLALEQAGIYIESITEVRRFAVSQDELRAYTAGIVEVTEHEARSAMEGQQQVVRVNVICKVDTDVVVRQIDALRKNKAVKTELLQARQEADRLRQELETKTRELAAVKSKAEVEAIAQARREVLTDQDVYSLLIKAHVALAGSSESLHAGSSSIEGRRRARILIEQASALDASNPDVQRITGVLLAEEGNLEGAIAAFRTAIHLKPDDAVAHYNLGLALRTKGDVDGTIAEYRAAIHLKPDYADAHNNLGIALAIKGDVEGAIAAYRTAIRVKPDHAVAHYNLGETLKAKGRRVEAAQELREYLRLTPDTPENRQSIKRARALLREVE